MLIWRQTMKILTVLIEAQYFSNKMNWIHNNCMFRFNIRDGHKHPWNWKFTTGLRSNFSDRCPNGVSKPKFCIRRNFIPPKFIGAFKQDVKEMQKEIKDTEIQSIISINMNNPTWIKNHCKLEDNEYVYAGYPVCCIHEYYEMIGATMELLSECYDTDSETCKFCSTPISFERERKSILDIEDLKLISDFYLEIITVFDNVITFQLMCEILSTSKCRDVIGSVNESLNLEIPSFVDMKYNRISDAEVDKFLTSIQRSKNSHADYEYFIRNDDERKLYNMTNEMAALYQTMQYIENVNQVHNITDKFTIRKIKCGNTTFKQLYKDAAETSWTQLFAFCPKFYPYHVFDKKGRCEKCGWAQDEESAKEIDIKKLPVNQWIAQKPALKNELKYKNSNCLLTIPERLIEDFIAFVSYAMHINKKIKVEEAVKIFGEDTKYWLSMNER